MNKLVFFLFSLMIAGNLFAQDSAYRTLFIIDSIPLFNDPESWNPITRDDIADIVVISNKDSIKLLGWENVDVLTYIFTKSFRSRPDSTKKIPSLKQLQNKNTIWVFNDTPYTGKYIDYYNNGKIQDEGNLADGILNGEVIVYYKNGNKKTVSHFKNGIRHGLWSEYYPNGIMSSTRNYTNGKTTGYQKEYFINGQVSNEIRKKAKTQFDSLVYYYSTGRVRQMRLIRNGIWVANKQIDDINYYNYHFYQSLNAGEIKEANKQFYKLWLIDSTSSDTHFKEGLLMLTEFKFDDALDAFDKALAIEPLMREALAHRALSRIKKLKYAGVNVFSKDFRETAITIKDIAAIPGDDQVKICKDVQLSKDLDFSDVYVQKVVPLVVLDYCQRNK